MNKCCTEKIFQSLNNQLSSGSVCDSEIEIMIPVFWDLVCQESGGSYYLQSLLTKREIILFLMGCESYSVDTKESHSTSSGMVKSDSRSDFNSQSQSTGSSNKFSTGHGETRYDEKSSSQSDSNSKKTSRSSEKGDGSSFYRDDGKGGGFNFSESFNFIENRVEHVSETDSLSTTTETGSRKDCNYERSENNTKGDVNTVAIISIGTTVSGSEWRKFSATNAFNISLSDSETTHYATEFDHGLTTSRGTHSWENVFQNDIDWFDNDFDIKISKDRSDTRRESTSHADGNGDGIHEERSESNNSSQGTGQSISDSETLRTSSRSSNTNGFSLANSQRFRNLQLLYDQLTLQIEHQKIQSRQLSTPLIKQLSCICIDRCTCGMIYSQRGKEILHYA